MGGHAGGMLNIDPVWTTLAGTGVLNCAASNAGKCYLPCQCSSCMGGRPSDGHDLVVVSRWTLTPLHH